MGTTFYVHITLKHEPSLRKTHSYKNLPKPRTSPKPKIGKYRTTP
jgi:hypothetical protein